MVDSAGPPSVGPIRWRRLSAGLEGPWPAPRYWILSGCAVAVLLCRLPQPYYGEEPVYVITTLESWWHQSWMNPIQLGLQYGRPPLLNWLAMPLVWLLGWGHVLLSIRIIAVASTVATAALLGWFAHYLSREPRLAGLCVACFLTGDLLTRRGWLAYSDPPLLGGGLRRHRLPLGGAGPAQLRAVAARGRRRHGRLPHGGSQGEGLAHDVLLRAGPRTFGSYVLGVLSFWAEVVLRMLPVSALLLALLVPPRADARAAPCPSWAQGLRWILLLGALPYLATPDNHMRHLLPLYPLFALVAAELALRRGAHLLAPLHALLIAWLVVAVPLTLAIDPRMEARHHGDAAATARLIAKATAGRRLYTIVGSSEALAVIAHLDVLRLPAEPVVVPAGAPDDSFFLASPPAPARFGREIAQYPMGRATLILLCKGSACVR